MRSFARPCALACLLPWAVRSCSPVEGWVRTRPEDQWSAASYVVYGAADAVMGCGLGFGQHDPEDEALFNASGLCEGQEYTSLVLLRNFSFTKGEVANCSEIVVGGFSSSPACGVDPPNAGSMGTYFLCTAMVQSGLCKGTLNTQGNIHLGFVSQAVTAPTDPRCPQDGTCYDVGECTPLTLSKSHWMTGVLGTATALLWQLL
ncbi:unnamed protein product [Symbiodinium natans]|uniref:Uncharacterized protein n=1 Tax=Symbiodinium natans TaxID=878477 RepID=A0A812NI39_9DINO|nr:unnamed protein product [Symbiodinium natans]